MSKKLLPLGSVFELNDNNQLLMVVGYYPVFNNRSYDYLGTPYPQGMLEFPTLIPVDETDIRKTIYEGFVDGDDQAVLNATVEYMQEQTRTLFELIKALGAYADGEDSSEAKNGNISYIDALLGSNEETTSGYTLG